MQLLPPNATDTLREALEVLDRGDAGGAEKIVSGAVTRAKSESGEDSRAYSVALNELGMVLVRLRRHADASNAFRDAMQTQWARGKDAIADFLVFQLNHAQALAHAGQRDEGHAVLRDALHKRRALYGAKHAAYAVVVEAMAELMLAKGDAAAAVEMLKEVVGIYRLKDRGRIVGAIASLGEAMKIAGLPGRAFDSAGSLNAVQIDQLARFVMARAQHERPDLMRRVLRDLVFLLDHRLGKEHPTTLNALTVLANLERKSGRQCDHAIRERAVRRVLAVHARRRDGHNALPAMLALAMAQHDSGQTVEGNITLQKALRIAERVNDAAMRARIFYQQGLFHLEMHDTGAAEDALWSSVAAGERSDKPEFAARAAVELGVLLTKASRGEEARGLFRDALTTLPAHDPDALRAKTQLEMLDGADPAAKLIEEFRSYVLGRVPDGLLKRLDVSLENRDFKIDMHLGRDATKEEKAHLRAAIDAALKQFAPQAKTLL